MQPARFGWKKNRRRIQVELDLGPGPGPADRTLWCWGCNLDSCGVTDIFLQVAWVQFIWWSMAGTRIKLNLGTEKTHTHTSGFYRWQAEWLPVLFQIVHIPKTSKFGFISFPQFHFSVWESQNGVSHQYCCHVKPDKNTCNTRLNELWYQPVNEQMWNLPTICRSCS